MTEHPSRRHLAWTLGGHDLRGAVDEVSCELYIIVWGLESVIASNGEEVGKCGVKDFNRNRR